MRKALLIVLGCPLLLFGDDSTELTNLELGQNPAIYNSVNVTNGNYVEMHNDCVVSGAEPIPLQRTHLSSDIDYHPGLFRFEDERLFIRIGRHGFPHTIKLKESSGAIIQFIPPTKAGYHTGQPAVWECAALSEGAAILRNALILYDEELRERIIPILVAPAAYIWNDINSRAWHYTSTSDCVPLIDLMGRARCKDTTTVLPRADGAPSWDHPIKSPTYLTPIKGKANEYSLDLKKWLDL